jgi:hypothetical protein
MSQEKEEVDISSLNESDQKMFLSQKMKMFKFTILTCVFYALCASVLLGVMLFTKWGKENIYEKMGYFVTTFIIGTFLMILVLIYYIIEFKPNLPKNQFGYDSQMCPDYWNLTKVDIENNLDEGDKKFFDENQNQNHFKYSCNMDKKIYSHDNILEKPLFEESRTKEIIKHIDDDVLKNVLNEADTVHMKDFLQQMNGYKYDGDASKYKPNNTKSTNNNITDANAAGVNSLPISCEKVYPAYLSTMDQEHAKQNGLSKSNKFRCAYASICDVPWTEAGCYKTT